MAVALLFDPTASPNGWFDAVATAPGWFDDDLGEVGGGAPVSGVQHDASAGNTDVSSTTITVAGFTVANNANRCLIVFASNRQASATRTITGITWNGSENLTKITDFISGNSGIEAWRLVNPTATTADIVVTYNLAYDNAAVTVSSYYNVHQTTPVGATNTLDFASDLSCVDLNTNSGGAPPSGARGVAAVAAFDSSTGFTTTTNTSAFPFSNNQGTANSATSQTSRTPALPGALRLGDIVFASCASENNATHSCATSGWNKLAQQNSGGSWTESIWWARYEGSLSAPTITWSGSADASSRCWQWRRGDPANTPTALLGTFGSGTGSTHSSTGANTTQNNTTVQYVDHCAANTALAQPSGWTELFDAGNATGPYRLAMGEKDVATSGSASGNISVTGGAAAWVQTQMEIYPCGAVQVERANQGGGSQVNLCVGEMAALRFNQFCWNFSTTIDQGHHIALVLLEVANEDATVVRLIVADYEEEDRDEDDCGFLASPLDDTQVVADATTFGLRFEAAIEDDDQEFEDAGFVRRPPDDLDASLVRRIDGEAIEDDEPDEEGFHRKPPTAAGDDALIPEILNHLEEAATDFDDLDELNPGFHRAPIKADAADDALVPDIVRALAIDFDDDAPDDEVQGFVRAPAEDLDATAGKVVASEFDDEVDEDGQGGPNGPLEDTAVVDATTFRILAVDLDDEPADDDDQGFVRAAIDDLDQTAGAIIVAADLDDDVEGDSEGALSAPLDDAPAADDVFVRILAGEGDDAADDDDDPGATVRPLHDAPQTDDTIVMRLDGLVDDDEAEDVDGHFARAPDDLDATIVRPVVGDPEQEQEDDEAGALFRAPDELDASTGALTVAFEQEETEDDDDRGFVRGTPDDLDQTVVRIFAVDWADGDEDEPEQPSLNFIPRDDAVFDATIVRVSLPELVDGDPFDEEELPGFLAGPLVDIVFATGNPSGTWRAAGGRAWVASVTASVWKAVGDRVWIVPRSARVWKAQKREGWRP